MGEEALLVVGAADKTPSPAQRDLDGITIAVWESSQCMLPDDLWIVRLCGLFPRLWPRADPVKGEWAWTHLMRGNSAWWIGAVVSGESRTFRRTALTTCHPNPPTSPDCLMAARRGGFLPFFWSDAG
jgi:hypothetical protein